MARPRPCDVAVAGVIGYEAAAVLTGWVPTITRLLRGRPPWVWWAFLTWLLAVILRHLEEAIEDSPLDL